MRQGWLLLQVHETLKDCRAGMKCEVKETAAALRTSLGSPTSVTETESAVFVMGRARFTTMDYKCLPDTVDPCGPKGQ